MLEDDDIKPIMFFVIIMTLIGFLWGYVIGANKKIDVESFTILSAVNSPVFMRTQVLGSVFIKDNEVLEIPTDELKIVYAYVSGYNTVHWQTDSTPCIAASGDNICGRTDVVACPRYIPLGTWVKIDGKNYQCLDRMAEKYTNDNYFDISFDKNIEKALAWGLQYKEVTILD